MQSDKPPLAVGIDLGTTFSCIAYIDEFGKPVVLKNFEGETVTPSVVFFPGDDHEVVVGQEARNNKNLEPERVVDFIKRSIGKPNGERFIDNRKIRPEEISSFVIKKLVQDAEQKLGRSISSVVITCPAYFGINEREATAQAGYIAGIRGYLGPEKPEIIPEPTAAAFYYGLQQQQKNEVVLVFDLGGGTFDLTLLSIRENEIGAIAIGGDHELGGKDWDDAIANFCLNEARENGADLFDLDKDPIALGELALKVEGAKRSLTAKDKTTIGIMLGGIRHRIQISRDQFEIITEQLLERCMRLTEEVLAAGRQKGHSAPDRILLVGGSSKMPQIKNRLNSAYPGVPVEFHDPDEAVAKGAALFAQKLMIDRMLNDTLFGGEEVLATPQRLEDLANKQPELVRKAHENIAVNFGIPEGAVATLSQTTLTNITSKSFGVVVVKSEQAGKKFIVNLICKNAALPAKIKQSFNTVADNQGSAEIRIMENQLLEQEVDLAFGTEIGNAVLPLPAGLSKGSPIEVEFSLDSSGLLKYSGRDLTGNRYIEGEIKTTSIMNTLELNQARERSSAITLS